MSKRMKNDFDPWQAVDALQGVTEALYWQLTQGPASERPMSDAAHASACGLAWAACRLSRELNEYFRAASEAGLELPKGGVRDEAARYGLN